MPRSLTLLLSLLACLVTILTPSASMAALRAAAATRPITPPDLTDLYIIGVSARRAEGVHDDLMARVLLLDTGREVVCFITLDLIGYMGWRIDDLKQEFSLQYGWPTGNIIISATHNHQGPDTIGIFSLGIGGMKVTYQDHVDAQVRLAVAEAVTRWEPVQLRFASTLGEEDWAWDSRLPWLIDHTISAMQAVGLDGNVVATLTNYGVHAEALWADTPYLTADYPAFLHERIEQHFGGISLYHAGSLGGLVGPNVLDTLGDENWSFTTARRYGQQVAERVISSIGGAALHADLNIIVMSRRISVPIENALLIGLVSLGQFEKPYSYLADLNFTLPTDIHLIRFGEEFCLATVPGELLPEVGFRLKEFLPEPVKMLTGLTGNFFGYMIPAEDYIWPPDPLNPGDHYEETVSAGPSLVPLVISTLHEMLGAPSPTPAATLSPTPTPTPSPTPTRRPRTPTVTPTPPPVEGLSIRATFSTQRDLSVELRLVSSTASPEVAAYVAVEVAGSFYFYPSFATEPTALASFSLAVLDTGWFALWSYPFTEPLPAPVTLTWYSVLIETGSGVIRGELDSSAVELR